MYLKPRTHPRSTDQSKFMAETSRLPGNADSTCSTRKPCTRMWQKGVDNWKMKGCQMPKILPGLWNCSVATHTTFMEMEGGCHGDNGEPRGQATSHGGLSLGLEPTGFAGLKCAIAWEWCFPCFSLSEGGCLQPLSYPVPSLSFKSK